MAAAQEELKVESGGSKKKLIIIVVLLLLLAGGGAAAYFFLFAGEPTEAVAEEPSEQTSAASGDAELGNALYVAMPRPFVFKVPGHSRDRTVQIKVQLLVRGVQDEETAKKHIPLIEDTMLKVFSGANANELGTVNGKEALKDDALKSLRDRLVSITGRPVIDKVLFTGFVMQ
ncbi:flagellar basal body-associated protein FliL [Gayadomonas joobiniege]|uniref:flagellar basal body-associated protein FliL n=1 Tax=Gayadomonas joobiniege TaxID=1234606 RepID=UPI00037D2BC4|nr:flagellar basal body-associated protein FliL [Gayadomonas joobiniege]